MLAVGSFKIEPFRPSASEGVLFVRAADLLSEAVRFFVVVGLLRDVVAVVPVFGDRVDGRCAVPLCTCFNISCDFGLVGIFKVGRLDGEDGIPGGSGALFVLDRVGD